MEGLDHIGIAVRDLRAARGLYEALGLRCSGVEEVLSEHVQVALFPIGDTRLELLQSTTGDGVIARFIERRGEGIHHICFRVRDLEGTLADLKSKGFRLVGGKPRRGEGGARVAFVHPASTAGVLLELREVP